MVKDIFTDFKRHDLGANFYERRIFRKVWGSSWMMPDTRATSIISGT